MKLIKRIWQWLFGRKVDILTPRPIIIPAKFDCQVDPPIIPIDEVVKDALQETRQKKRTYHARSMTDREKQLYYGRGYKAFENYKRHIVLILFLFLFSCKKESQRTDCWVCQVQIANGYPQTKTVEGCGTKPVFEDANGNQVSSSCQDK